MAEKNFINEKWKNGGGSDVGGGGGDKGKKNYDDYLIKD
jgi:hypothetical protein